MIVWEVTTMGRICSYIVYWSDRVVKVTIKDLASHVSAMLRDGSSCFAVYINGKLYGKEYVIINVAMLLQIMIEQDDVINDALDAISNVLKNGTVVGEMCEEV